MLMSRGPYRHRRVHPRRWTPTQYQQHYEEYQQAQNQAYYEEPQQYHFDAYQQHRYEDHLYQLDIEQPQQQEGGGNAQGLPIVEYKAGLDNYGEEPSVPTLLLHFGRHVACMIWVDANVSVFNVYFTYFNVYLTCMNDYFTYFMLELKFMLEYI